MKRYLLAVAGFALLGGSPLLAQPSPTAVPYDTPRTSGDPQRTTGYAWGGPGTKTVCLPEQYTKKTTKWVYNSCSEPLCLCYFHGLFKHGCGSCDKSGHCEKPYVRRYMVKKIRTCETPATRCVPTEVPACEGGHHHGGHQAAGGPVYGAPVGVAPGPVYFQGPPVVTPGTVVTPRP